MRPTRACITNLHPAQPLTGSIDLKLAKPRFDKSGHSLTIVPFCPSTGNRKRTMQLTVRDATRLLTVSEKTIYRWINQGSLPAYRVNEQYRFNRAELLEWATAHKINVSVEIVCVAV